MIRHYWQTFLHRFHVARFLFGAAFRLLWRSQVHDLSKYGRAEASVFAEVSPRLEHTAYGTEAYRELLEGLGGALEHHYAANSHHPEHYENGVRGMDLYDLVEMYCDWRAAIRRVEGGDLRDSIRHNADRFDLDRQVVHILANTCVADGH